MFRIASPQTVVLTVPGEDAQPISLTFHTGTKDAPNDVSSCVVDVLMPNGDVHVVTFGTAGKLADVQFVEYRTPLQPAPPVSPVHGVVNTIGNMGGVAQPAPLIP